MNKISKLILFLTLMPAMLLAQKSRANRNPQMKAEIEQLRKNTYNQVLGLTNDEAQKFWPVFNKMEDQLKAIKRQERALRKEVKDNYNTLNDADMQKNIDQMLNYEQQILDLKKKYVIEFEKVIPVKKVALLPKAEHEFKKALLEKIRSQQDGEDPPN